MVIMREPVYPLTIVEARPIGIMKMEDSGDKDWKVLAVPVEDPYFKDWKDIDDVPKAFLDEIAHFFQRYKELQGKVTKVEAGATPRRPRRRYSGPSNFTRRSLVGRSDSFSFSLLKEVESCTSS